MNEQSCPREQEVIAAFSSGLWTDEMRLHAGQCPDCGETLRVSIAMRQVAAATSAEVKHLASYQTIWLRAQFTRRHEQLSKLDRVMLLGVFMAGFVGAIGAAVWKWETVLRWTSRVSGETSVSMPFYAMAGFAALLWFLVENVFYPDR